MLDRAVLDGSLEEHPRLLLLASKLGYQTRSFAEAARRLGIDVVIGSDRCHQLDDPWSDGAIALHFEEPEEAAQRLVEAVRARPVRAILALGDRQTVTAAYAARALGLPTIRLNPWRIAAANCVSARCCGARSCPCRSFSRSR